ncbi:MAG TPA: DUF1801 domain-containing protein [Steroidobacteraceae bacterium]|nr:DUF1801 domain-containing protein [Steroidobacteraceae bacterium]
MAKPEQRAVVTGSTAEKQLRSFVAKFSSQDQARIRAVRRALRKRLPGAFELVYDNYNFFVIGYGPTERPSEAVVSVAAQANRLALCFLHGAALPDPHGLLRGSGRQVRSVPLHSAADLGRPELQALLREAFDRAVTPLQDGPVRLIIRSVSAKQRPRRKLGRRAT